MRHDITGTCNTLRMKKKIRCWGGDNEVQVKHITGGVSEWTLRGWKQKWETPQVMENRDKTRWKQEILNGNSEVKVNKTLKPWQRAVLSMLKTVAETQSCVLFTHAEGPWTNFRKREKRGKNRRQTKTETSAVSYLQPPPHCHLMFKFNRPTEIIFTFFSQIQSFLVIHSLAF